ncbi:MAG TPA: MBG domain-containing protein, partial [Blastocatellia bacterium]|nr:MBG domain-containing protein [Blastocatellia bacterium]
ATLTVTADNKSKAYGAALPALTVSYSGFVNGDTAGSLSGAPSVSTTAQADSNAGSYPITVTAGSLSSPNYAFTFAGGTLTISKAALSVRADDKSKAYGAALPTLTVSYSGFVNGDSQAALSGAPDVATTATASSNAGSYPITAAAGTLSSPNYDFTFANGTLTVTQVPLTVTADNKSKAYGTALPALTVSYSGFVNGDTAGSLTGTPGLTTTATAGSGVGSYPITAAAGSLGSANYNFVFADGTLTVAPVALTIKADNKSKAYGAALPAFTATYTGFVNGDTESVLGGTLNLTTTATASSDAGAYPITPGGVTAANYTINFANGTLTVTMANAAINAVANNSSPVIGQSVTFTATINAVGGGAGATGTVTFKDGATVLGTGTLNGSGQATFTTSGLAVGSHSITAEYGGDTNYSAATSPVLDLTVNKASTTTTVASSANPSTVDQAVTFTATVTSSSSGTPSGSVEFFDGTTSLGTATLSGGSATVTTSTLTVGDHSITAVHSGDATFAGSTSVALAQKVNAACTYTLSKTTQMSDASGGTYSVTVTTRSDCAWTAVSNVSWIQITSGASGTGDGTVTYTVAPLDTVTMRTGTLTIAGQTLTVTQSRTFTLVSAASYDGTAIANDEILAGFGNGISSVTDTAMSLPLPTSLGEVQIKFKDSAGAERFAELLFVSPLQINFVTPPDLAYGTAMVTVINGGTEIAAGTVEVAAVAPSFFSVNSSGSGLAAALALRVKPDGSQSYESIAEFDAGQNVFVPVPIDIGSDPNAATDEVFLVMFGTGLRHRTSQENVTVKIGGVDAEVLYAAEQPTFRGEDQVNIRIPRSLIGRGEVDVVVTVDGKAANTVKINIR